MQIYYLEIVTPDVDAVCSTYAQLHGVSFSEPEPGLGNARTASLPDGGKVGVRAAMHEEEEPVVRPYLLVDDVETAACSGPRRERQGGIKPNDSKPHSMRITLLEVIGVIAIIATLIAWLPEQWNR